MSLPVSEMSFAVPADFYGMSGTDVSSVGTLTFSVVWAHFHSIVFAPLLTHLSPSGWEHSTLQLALEKPVFLEISITKSPSILFL